MPNITPFFILLDFTGIWVSESLCFFFLDIQNQTGLPTPSCHVWIANYFEHSFCSFPSTHACVGQPETVDSNASSQTMHCNIFLFQILFHVVISHVVLETPPKKFIPHCHPFVLTRTTRSCRRRHEPYQPRHEGGREKFKRFREMLWPFHMSL